MSKRHAIPESPQVGDILDVDTPEGWTLSRLGDGLVCDVQPGFACGVHNQKGDGVPHLRPMNVSQDGRIALADLKFVPKTIADRDERWVRRGDVVFNNTNSPELVGKTAYYDLPEPRAFSNHMTRIRCHKEVLDPAYCAMHLHYRWREGYFESVCNNHVSQASVSRAVLLEAPILLPPMDEQKRIVAKVEELLARVNTARERLARVPAILKRFRQSILAAACSGRLTADWRNANTRIDTAHSLLERILARRRKLLGDPSRGEYRKPFDPEAMADDNFPEQWASASMDQLTLLVTSGSRGWASYYSDTGALFVRAQDINTDQLMLADVAHVTPPANAEGQRTRIQYGDLLITITGANVTKSALVNSDLGEAYVSQHVALTRPVDISIRQFMHLWTISPLHGRAKLLADAYGAGKPGLNLDNIRQLVVALPPIEEQVEIVRRVENLFKLLDTIETRLATGAFRASKLTQAILAKAFRGELVPTEAEMARTEGRPYEPASVLLDRIRASRVRDSSLKGLRSGKAGEHGRPKG